ncbi:hypothetical protein JUNP406_3415 [Acinetobacter baumannii]
MSTRHLVMISLGGAIGTGLFLGSGDVISQAGPIGAIISYFLGGLIAYTVMLCLGELAVHVPESGSFGEYARRYIGPGTGYMITWLGEFKHEVRQFQKPYDNQQAEQISLMV